MRRRTAHRPFLPNDSGPTGISFSANPSIQKSQSVAALGRNEPGLSSVSSINAPATTPERTKIKQEDNPEKQSTLALLKLASNNGNAGVDRGAAFASTKTSSGKAMIGDHQYQASQCTGSSAGGNIHHYPRRPQILPSQHNTHRPTGIRETVGQQQAHDSPSWGGGVKPSLRIAQPIGMNERQIPETQHLHPSGQSLSMTMPQHTHDFPSAGQLHHQYSSSYHQQASFGSNAELARPRELAGSAWNVAPEDSRQSLLRATARLAQEDVNSHPSFTQKQASHGHGGVSRADIERNMPAIDLLVKKSRLQTAGASNTMTAAMSETKDHMGPSRASKKTVRDVLKARPYLTDYSVGLALRKLVLMPSGENVTGEKHQGKGRLELALEFCKYFRGERVLIRSGAASNTGGIDAGKGKKELDMEDDAEYARREREEKTNVITAAARKKPSGKPYALLAFLENSSSSDAKVLHDWYYESIRNNGGDAYLPRSSVAWSDAWVTWCRDGSQPTPSSSMGDVRDDIARNQSNREVIKVVLNEEDCNGESADENNRATLIGFAYIERNCDLKMNLLHDSSPCSLGTSGNTSNGTKPVAIEKSTEICVTCIHDIRIAPFCNPEIKERLESCAKTGLVESSDGHVVHSVRPVDVLSALFHHTLHRSLLFGTDGVTVHCPKEGLFEQFFSNHMGKPIGRDKNGRCVFRLCNEDRIQVIRNGFSDHCSMLRDMKEPQCSKVSNEHDEVKEEEGSKATNDMKSEASAIDIGKSCSKRAHEDQVSEKQDTLSKKLRTASNGSDAESFRGRPSQKYRHRLIVEDGSKGESVEIPTTNSPNETLMLQESTEAVNLLRRVTDDVRSA